MSSLPPINSNPRYLDVGSSSAATPSPATTNGKLTDLTAIIEDTTGAYTPQQKLLAGGQRTAREYVAYGNLAANANASGNNTSYLKAYRSYYNNLSPAEQQSDRYVGTGAAAQTALSGGNTTGGTAASASNGSALPSPTVANAATTPSSINPSGLDQTAGDRAVELLALQQNYKANDPTNTQDSSSILSGTDLLSGLRALLGIIQDEQHPTPPTRIPLPPIDFKA